MTSRPNPRLRLVHSAPPRAPVLNATPVYRVGEANYCPACTGRNFYVGRLLAECGRCGCALPLAGVEVGR